MPAGHQPITVSASSFSTWFFWLRGGSIELEATLDLIERMGGGHDSIARVELAAAALPAEHGDGSD